MMKYLSKHNYIFLYFLLFILNINKILTSSFHQANYNNEQLIIQDDLNHRVYEHQQRIFLLSIDGLRNDYIYTYNMNSLLNIMNDGVKAKYLNPQFSTQTLPNLWGLITGL
jgi:predicted AlkP superfamily pyrophosphatase or phosphodiesterase